MDGDPSSERERDRRRKQKRRKRNCPSGSNDPNLVTTEGGERANWTDLKMEEPSGHAKENWKRRLDWISISNAAIDRLFKQVNDYLLLLLLHVGATVTELRRTHQVAPVDCTSSKEFGTPAGIYMQAPSNMLVVFKM